MGTGYAPPGAAQHEMSARLSPSVDACHRVRVLRALGIVTWTRRLPACTGGDAVEGDSAAGPSVAPGGHITCAVVLAADCSSRALDLLGRALNAGGPIVARAGRIHLRNGQLSAVPAAATFLVFGTVQAEALRRTIPVEASCHTQVVVVDELESVLTDAGAKRRLWMALRGLRAKLAPASD